MGLKRAHEWAPWARTFLRGFAYLTEVCWKSELDTQTDWEAAAANAPENDLGSIRNFRVSS